MGNSSFFSGSEPSAASGIEAEAPPVADEARRRSISVQSDASGSAAARQYQNPVKKEAKKSRFGGEGKGERMNKKAYGLWGAESLN